MPFPTRIKTTRAMNIDYAGTLWRNNLVNYSYLSPRCCCAHLQVYGLFILRKVNKNRCLLMREGGLWRHRAACIASSYYSTFRADNWGLCHSFWFSFRVIPIQVGLSKHKTGFVRDCTQWIPVSHQLICCSTRFAGKFAASFLLLFALLTFSLTKERKLC